MPIIVDFLDDNYDKKLAVVASAPSMLVRFRLGKLEQDINSFWKLTTAL